MEEIREKIISELEAMKRTADNEKDVKTLSCTIMMLDGLKHKALWINKEYRCPICERVLNPSYMKECPKCRIKILYKKSGGNG